MFSVNGKVIGVLREISLNKLCYNSSLNTKPQLLPNSVGVIESAWGFNQTRIYCFAGSLFRCSFALKNIIIQSNTIFVIVWFHFLKAVVIQIATQILIYNSRLAKAGNIRALETKWG